MFCPQCGKQLDEVDQFCRWCGRSLSTGKPTSAGIVPGSGAGAPATKAEQPVRRSGEATASLILGLFSFVPVVGLLAVIFGHMANASIRRSGGRLLGEGMAALGLVLGYFGLAGWAIYGLSFVVHPFLPSTRIEENEKLAVGSLKNINTAEIAYATMYSTGYSATLAALGPPKTANPNLPADEYVKLIRPDAAGLLDEVLTSGTESGYRFTYSAGKPDKERRVNEYTVHADPITPGETGLRHFFTDQSGVIRQEVDRPAGEQSSPLAG
jgi:hypothetical protein